MENNVVQGLQAFGSLHRLLIECWDVGFGLKIKEDECELKAD